jgi:stage V sporulation protein B
MAVAGSSVFSLLLALVILPIQIHYLGVAAFGLYALIVAITAYFSSFRQGPLTAIVKNVAEYEGSGEKEKIHITITAGVLGNGLLGLVLGLIVFCLSYRINDIFNVPSALQEEAKSAIAVSALYLIIYQPLAVFSSVFIGFQEYKFTSLLSSARSILKSGLIFLIIALKGSVTAFLVSEYSILIFGEIFLAIILYRRMKHVKVTLGFRGIIDELTAIFSYGKYSILYLSANNLIYQMDRIIIGYFLPLKAVSYYEIATKLNNIANTLSLYLTSAVTPAVANAIGARDYRFVEKLAIVGAKVYVLIMLPFAVNLVLFANPIITYWIGKEYADHSTSIAQLLIGAWIVNICTSYLVQIYWGQGTVRKFSLMSMGAAVINVALGIALLQYWGAVGMAMATFLTASFFMPIQLNILAKSLDLSAQSYIINAILPGYIIHSVYGLVILLLSHFQSPWGLTSTIALFFTSLAVAYILSFFALSKSERHTIGKYLVNIFSLIRFTDHKHIIK